MSSLSFSGHETFSCKQFWLKKGFDYIKTSKKFSDKTAVVDLGVGKNMVTAIRFWLQAFGISKDKETASEFGEYLFGEAGSDIYLEDIGSVWLLHYFLVKEGKSSIYNLFFNDFRPSRTEFKKEHLHDFLKRKCQATKKGSYNENTIDKDISVFFKNYQKPSSKKTEVENSFSGLLHELKLVSSFLVEDESRKIKENWHKIAADFKENLPYQIVLFSILDNPNYKTSIAFKDLEIAKNSPRRVFALSRDGLFDKIQSMVENYKDIIYSETAGNRILQIPSGMNKWKILDDYYNN